MSEAWRPVPGFEGLYEVSDLGRIWSVRSKKFLKPDDSDDYLRVTFYMRGVGTRLRVHEVVLLAFVGPRPDGYECRHLNGDGKDGRLANLAWGTLSENQRDRVQHGTHNVGNRTTCKYGHSLADAHISEEGWRFCAVCYTAPWKPAWDPRKGKHDRERLPDRSTV